jgi:2'-5' RNA ligase
MRLFVAITLSDEMKKTVTGTLHALKKAGVKGNYVPAQNLHLTLAFIGETKDSTAVKEALQTVKWKSFRLSLAEMGTFGDLLWVGLKGNQGLSAAVQEVRGALDAAGIAYDKKKFAPHITIIRKMSGNWKSLPAPKGEMMVKKISLMKSEVRDGKRVYTEIFAVEV